MTEMHVDVWRTDRVHTVMVTGVLDFANSIRLRMVLAERLDAGARNVVVDLAGVRILDASATGVLLQALERMRRHDGTLRVRGATGLPLKVLEVTGAAKTLAGYDRTPTEDDGTERRHVGTDRPEWHGVWGDDVNALLASLSGLPPDHPDRPRLRERIVETCLPFARRLAHRFHGLGESNADLNQVAALGLLKAVNRFDPGCAADFASFATPTILGELKRHFRDRGWSVRVPRRLQELRLQINRARDELTQRLGRSPTIQDLARYLTIDEDHVLDAMVAANGYRAISLDAPAYPGDDVSSPLASLGTEDDRLEAVDNHSALQPLLSGLPYREQRIINLRFYGNLTQAEIGRRLGISQMHVSRLLAHTLQRLREDLLSGA
jgi:RNA polymerase sigma-B factor